MPMPTYTHNGPSPKLTSSTACRAADRATLERLYTQKATLETLIESLEEYARCRSAASRSPIRRTATS
jgi:hypothetical protein